MKRIKDLVLNLRNEYLAKEGVNSFEDINNGHCVDFAEELDRLVFETFGERGEVISNDYFIMRVDEDAWCGDYDDIWIEINLESYGSPLPEGLTTDDLTIRIRGYHCWFYFNGKHYDAETPDGVDSLFDLPFFEKHLVNEYNDWLA